MRKKQVVYNLVSISFDSLQLGMQLKETVLNFRLLIRRYSQSWFFRKESGKSSSSTFCIWFFKKNVFMLYSINWPNFIVCLALLLEILSNMCIAINCFPGCDVINFEINPIFLAKPFFYKKSRQKFKYLENEKNF